MFADAVIVVGWGTTVLCTGIWVAYLAGWARLFAQVYHWGNQSMSPAPKRTRAHCQRFTSAID
jgi:hypothetical protein